MDELKKKENICIDRCRNDRQVGLGSVNATCVLGAIGLFVNHQSNDQLQKDTGYSTHA
jgi:hypothetical protein